MSLSPPNRLLWVADLMLLAVAIVWGTSYGVVKFALDFYPVLGLLALRFGITFVVLSPALRSLRGANRASIAGAVLCGVLLLAIFLAETYGVAYTHASNAAFLISLCVVLTPLVEWAMLRRRPSAMDWVAVSLSLVGAAMVTGGVIHPTGGDALILLAALLRAIVVCVTKRVMRDARLAPLTVTAIQAGVVTAGSLVVALAIVREPLPALPSLAENGAFWLCIGYLVVACTLFAFFAQNYAVKRSSPTRVALLMGGEPAFGALFAYLWLGEQLSVWAWCGGALMVLASLLATVRWPSRAPGVASGIEVPREA
ncbi:DMT family transporter [Cupriavidus plantarum]|uniref:DMT family transporter n=1 Tax=Cupriavidus plantarum TaxID=942865 RepID=UPI0015C8D057|nr:DMT family transporter [Cupriavidus plantarum]NYH98913.1 drug/metabolite transporter (DMT)-like permease [Cupriavidus plantarum]